ncbi:MAG: SpoIID/LytB domain-containing protein [Clostridia bacterium]|nr:SpoIID/LytB domain-containing protein [Clostridia bacterium]
MNRRPKLTAALILSVSLLCLLTVLVFLRPGPENSYAAFAAEAGAGSGAPETSSENTPVTPEGTAAEQPAETPDAAVTVDPSSHSSTPAGSGDPDAQPTEQSTEQPTTQPTTAPTPEPTPEPLPSVEPHVNTVRIGLKYNKSALDIVTTGSDTGGTIGVVKNNSAYTPVLAFNASGTVTLRADTGYHIAVTSGFSNVEDARREMLKIKALMDGGGISMLYIFDGSSWYVGGAFYSAYPGPGVKDVNGIDKYTVLSERLTPHGYTLSVVTVRNNGVKVYIDGSPVMILNVSDAAYKVRITPLQGDGSGNLPPLLKLSAARYRGYFDVHRYQGGKLVLVNDVDVEDYLYSVVPAEMISGTPASWSWRKEGLKAQAILARTSAYEYIIPNKLTAYGFHMDDTTNYQVYSGYIDPSGEAGETQNTTRATDETAGLILTYNGQLCEEVFYHSNSGGYTETPDAVWGGDRGIFQSIPDPWTTPATYTREYTGASLSSRIVSYVSNQKGVDLGTLSYLNVTQRTISGRVTEMVFEGTKNDSFVRLTQTRSSLNLKGQRFYIDVDETVTIDYQSDGQDTSLSPRARKFLEGNLYSEAFLPDTYAVKGSDGYTYERIRIRGASDPKQIMIHGIGTGHGVGMSQDGAEVMSKEGKTCEEIITFYMPGVQIAELREIYNN